MLRRGKDGLWCQVLSHIYGDKNGAMVREGVCGGGWGVTDPNW